jgi:hypothetical protein
MKLRVSLLALPLMAAVSFFGATQAMAQGVQAFAVMLGGNEPAGGDPDGYGAVAITFHGKTTICVGYVVDRIGKPTAAHIHDGIAGVNGPPVIPFPVIPTTGSPGNASFCADVDDALFTRIRNSPSDFYVNVHNDEFPGGAIRGQLF